ncbi:hypothetical protein [Streptomyces flaveolus]|uniref:hypothetical protein n=1 Tax=Streptomyces flaveolus TaxID=67297 RepID=UPI0033319C88
MVRQAVRTAPPPPPTDPPADPAVAARRRRRPPASTHAIGELILEVAPAYLSDTDAANVLALLCDQIDEPLQHGFSARADETPADQRRRAARCARPSFWARGL